jgi:micrococcal nuclease
MVSVEAVLNGDRVNVTTTEGRYTVFLLGIDAPEATPLSGSPECFGPEAKAKLGRMLKPKQQIWLEQDGRYQDPSGRMVRYVWLPSEGKQAAALVNRSLLSGGYAILATGFDNLARYDDFVKAQAKAQTDGKGLWTACARTPTPIPAPAETPFEESGDESSMPPVDPGVVYQPPVVPTAPLGPGEMYDALLNPPASAAFGGREVVVSAKGTSREIINGVQTGIVDVDLQSGYGVRYFVMESAEAATAKILEDSASWASRYSPRGPMAGGGMLYPIPLLSYPAAVVLRDVSPSSGDGVIYCWGQVGNVVVHVVSVTNAYTFEANLPSANIRGIGVLINGVAYVKSIQQAGSGASQPPAGSATVVAMLNDNDVWLRSGPSRNAPTVRLLSKGMTFQVSGVENGPFPDGDGDYWWLVSDGTVEGTGFINAEFLDVPGH